MKRILPPAVVLIVLALGVISSGRPLAAGDDATSAGFKPIFNGATLDGWDGDPNFWRVEDGSIVGQTTPSNPARGNTFLIWRGGELDDFELELEYRITGGNSGIQVRSREDEKWGKWVIGGYQADIDSAGRYTGIVYEERGRAILAERGQKTVIGADGKPKPAGTTGDPAEIQAAIRKDGWNAYHIRAAGHALSLKINGHVTAEISDEDPERRRRSGLLALQLHAGPPMMIEFRNVRLKRLPMGDRKKVVFIAGRPSHGYGAHEHNAGCLLLARCLNDNAPGIHAVVYRNGWPIPAGKEKVFQPDPTAFDNADAIVQYCDGGRGHMALPHLQELGALMKKGVGMACLHYAVEPADDRFERPNGRKEFLEWLGGYFEVNWSVNPHWVAQFKKLPEHPITRGVKPFEINDEWYFFMRFPEGLKGVTPILSAVAGPDTMKRPDGTHSGNPAVRASVARGDLQHVAWAIEREDGGRGFGFTGGHFHWNWGNDDFRKLALNAIAWIARAEVPEAGIPSGPISREDLEADQDEPKPGK